MASTRSKTGNSRPRVFPTEEPATGAVRKTTTKKTGPRKKTTTTTTTKPGAKTAGGRVSKKGATGAQPKRKSHVSDKIEGAVLKAEGKITGKEGKKAAGTKKIHGTDGKHAKTSATKIKA